MSCVWWRGVGVGWGYEISCVLSREGDVGAWVLLCRPIGRVMWVHGYCCASLGRPKYSCLQVCCQSINLKMVIRAETCSWYLCNKQHISNYQIVVFDSWLIQLYWRSILILSSHLRFGSLKWPLSLRFPHQNPVYATPLPIRASCTAHLILLDFTTRSILGEE